jgi:beta-RFAP synthase
MLGFGHVDRAQFGGVGLMIDPPRVELAIRPAARFAAGGPLAGRVEQFVEALRSQWQLESLPACEIEVSSPPDHAGLGVGTALGLAAAAGLRRFLGFNDLPVEALARSLGRGARSAVGTHGFRLGGLIVDAGKTAGQPLGTLARSAALPGQWRVVLMRTGSAPGLAGDQEAEAFARLPAVPAEVTRELWRITQQEMLPAVEQSDCRRFGEAVYRFGRLAGECFAAIQGSAFANPEIARIVQAVRDHGVSGVGQSSWGPTVFAFTSGDAEALALCEWLQAALAISSRDLMIGRPANHGVQIITH